MQAGCNMKKIASLAEAKLRVRGVGSGHLEGRPTSLKSQKIKILNNEKYCFIPKYAYFLLFCLGPTMQESLDPLQICISAPSKEQLELARGKHTKINVFTTNLLFSMFFFL